MSLGGPPLGGALVEWASWRCIFFLNVPLAVTAVTLAWVGQRASARLEEPRSRLDVFGAGLVALGIGSLAYGLVQGGEEGFADVAWSFPLAGAALAAFLVRERRTREPLLPLSLFRSQDFALVNLATLLIYSAVAGSAFFLVLFLQSWSATPRSRRVSFFFPRHSPSSSWLLASAGCPTDSVRGRSSSYDP